MEFNEELETIEFGIGKHKIDPMHARILVKGQNPQHLEDIWKEIYPLSAIAFEVAEAAVASAPAEIIFHENFSKINNPQKFTSMAIGSKPKTLTRFFL